MMTLSGRCYCWDISPAHGLDDHTHCPGHVWHWEQLDTTAAWNTRSGPQLQWLGASSRYLFFNDLRCRAIANVGSASLTAAAVKVRWAPQKLLAGPRAVCTTDIMMARTHALR
jgi:hypothetical protein